MAIRPGPRNLLTDVAGLLVGHAMAQDYATGTTVVLAEEPAIAAVDVRGGGPGTRETAALAPEAAIQTIDAVVLSGGSAFGLAAADGAMDWLRRQGRGVAAGGTRVPIVPAAILFDLPFRRDPSRDAGPLPYAALGHAAIAAAGQDFALGNAGAGLGATTAGLKGGTGSASAVWEGVTVGALAAVNAFGSALIPGTRAFLAAPWEIAGEFGGIALPPHAPDPTAIPRKRPAAAGANTTICVVATDAVLTRSQALRLAIMAQDGIARALHPAHTPYDGDTVFALSTGRVPVAEGALFTLGSLAAMCLARAIARGVYTAEALEGIPAWRDLR